MYGFDYQKPTDLAAAKAALAAEGAQALSGGQTLIPVLKQRLAMPSALIDLTGIEAMKGIRRVGDHLVIGAATPHAVVAASADVQNAIPGIASLASIGGSVANNDPAACYPSAVLGCGAIVETDRREVAADDFFRGLYETVLKEGEIITAVKFPVPSASTYQKFEQPASRFSLTSVFIARFANGVRVAVTGAGAQGVFRHEGLEQALSANFSQAAVDAIPVSADNLASDLHATPEYRACQIKTNSKRVYWRRVIETHALKTRPGLALARFLLGA